MNQKYPTLWARILANTELDPDGCWIWKGQRSSTGGRYPQISMRVEGKHKTLRAHRLVAEIILRRPLHPVDETIEHTCYKTGCISPNCTGMMTNSANASAARHKGEYLPGTLTMLNNEGRYWHPEEPIPF